MPVVKQQYGEHHGADTEVEHGRRQVRKRQDFAGKVDLRYQLSMGDDGMGRVIETGREKAPDQQSAVSEQRVRNALAWNPGDAPERQRENKHQSDRLEDSPRKSQDRLFVADSYAVTR